MITAVGEVINAAEMIADPVDGRWFSFKIKVENQKGRVKEMKMLRNPVARG